MWEHTAISRYKYVGRTDKECSGWCHEIETYPEVDIFPMDKRPFISRREIQNGGPGSERIRSLSTSVGCC